MPRSQPFIDRETGGLDTDQIRQEVFPLAGLVALFAGLALVPLVFVFLSRGTTPLNVFFTLVAQFVLAVGAGIVLMYVVARGIQLADA